MELSDIISKLEKELEETNGYFESELHFKCGIVVIEGNIFKDIEPASEQFYSGLNHQSLEITEAFIQFPDFEAGLSENSINEIEKHF